MKRLVCKIIHRILKLCYLCKLYMLKQLFYLLRQYESFTCINRKFTKDSGKMLKSISFCCMPMIFDKILKAKFLLVCKFKKNTHEEIDQHLMELAKLSHEEIKNQNFHNDT